jgi:regulator of sigma E protease
MLSLFIVWCSLVLEVIAFFLARVAVSSAIGLRGRSERLGFVPEAWRAVSLLPRLVFAAAGPFGCYLVAAGCFALSLCIAGEARVDSDSMRVSPAPQGPAAASGVEEGDRVVSVDGAPVGDWAALRARIRASQGRAVPLVVDRAGRQVELRPVVGSDGRIGVAPLREHRSFTPGEAIVAGLQRPFRVLADTFRTLFRSSGPIETSGPVGIVREVVRTSRDPAPIASALALAGILLSYFLFIPLLAASILFPRDPPSRSARPLA